MKKMIINSFYNTLIDKEDAIPLSTMLEIERIRKSGNKYVILTNRSAKELEFYNRDFPFIDYIISFNGNYVLDLENNKCLIAEKIREKDIELIKEIYPKNNKIFYTLDNNYCDDILCNDIYKVEIELSPREVKKVELINNEHLKSSLFVYNKKTYLEITSSKSNNCKAVELITKLENIKKSDITTILGNDSEIDLLKYIKSSYVVSNAKEIKKLATNKTKSNNAKGSENIIKKIQ